MAVITHTDPRFGKEFVLCESSNKEALAHALRVGRVEPRPITEDEVRTAAEKWNTSQKEIRRLMRSDI